MISRALRTILQPFAFLAMWLSSMIMILGGIGFLGGLMIYAFFGQAVMMVPIVGAVLMVVGWVTTKLFAKLI